MKLVTAITEDKILNEGRIGALEVLDVEAVDETALPNSHKNCTYSSTTRDSLYDGTTYARACLHRSCGASQRRCRAV